MERNAANRSEWLKGWYFGFCFFVFFFKGSEALLSGEIEEETGRRSFQARIPDSNPIFLAKFKERSFSGRKQGGCR